MRVPTLHRLRTLGCNGENRAVCLNQQIKMRHVFLFYVIGTVRCQRPVFCSCYTGMQAGQEKEGNGGIEERERERNMEATKRKACMLYAPSYDVS